VSGHAVIIICIVSHQLVSR